jgi:hypothetical protein
MATTYRMTITIPVGVKEQIDQVKENVNWSAVAAEAFQRKVVEIRARRSKAMTRQKVIERLKAAGEADPQGFESGRAFGRKWAEEKALPRYLRNLAKDTDKAFEWHVDPQDPEQVPYREIASTLEGVIAEVIGDGSFWDEAVGPGGYALANCEDFARGFVAGALEVWEEVKDELS